MNNVKEKALSEAEKKQLRDLLCRELGSRIKSSKENQKNPSKATLEMVLDILKW